VSDKALKYSLEAIPPPPKVAITPCDPWPRPYYFENGYRRVQPYHYTYNTWCKQRWRGREILDIFIDEFRDRTVEYYTESIKTGAVVVNGKPVASVKTLIKNGDVISHTLHRHEPPVTAEPIGIVHESEDLIVINKPAGVPVHPAGRYNYNSIIEIMRAERGLGFNPLPCNRLDRLTSGIMFIAKHRAAAERITEQLTARTVRKEYVARVKGRFPDGQVLCEQPVLQISPKLGLNRVRANGKSASTTFYRIGYCPENKNKSGNGVDIKRTASINVEESERDDDTGYSIVLCRPHTGRTHQLRVHLQYLGHPIANDPIYSNRRVFGPDLGKLCSSPSTDESIIERLAKMGKEEVSQAVAWHDEMVDEYNTKKAEKLNGEKCEICNTELYSDPGEHEMGIWLHAKRYESSDGSWGYETEMPKWAVSDENMIWDEKTIPPLG